MTEELRLKEMNWYEFKKEKPKSMINGQENRPVEFLVSTAIGSRDAIGRVSQLEKGQQMGLPMYWKCEDLP